MPERLHHHFEQDDLPVKKKVKLIQNTSEISGINIEPATKTPQNENKKSGTNPDNFLPSNGSLSSKREKHVSRSRETNKSANPERQQSSKKSHESLKEKAKALLQLRQQLPIWSESGAICHGLRSKDVLLLVGETGSGKSTQLPQFLTSESWCQRQDVRMESNQNHNGPRKISVGGCIGITEPRRVAAITLARRVADEFGSTLGSASPASKVGYSVRFDNSTSPSTKIKFLTDGMLLQEMLRDPWLKEYSAVVVDEVHERGVNVDLLLGFLSRIVAGKNEGRFGVPLKVIVMSATADMQGLLGFFESGFHDSVEGNGDRSGPQEHENAPEDDDGSDWSGLSSSDPQTHENVSKDRHREAVQGRHVTTPKIQSRTRNAPEEQATNGASHKDIQDKQSSPSSTEHVSVCYVEGRQYPVKIIYTLRAIPDIIESSLRTIFELNYREPLPGDILVFLPGQSTVENLCNLVQSHASHLSPTLPKLLALPLFAALPQHAQQLVFRPAPPRTRKVIIATNIAETSLTVPGVRHVIDSGKSKIKQYRPQLGLDSLLVKPISQSAAIQRAGRAGREGPGSCHRLYTIDDFAALAPVPEPEILRADLAQAVLALKAQGVPTRDLPKFPFLSPPPREALEAAILHLHRLGALDEDGEINRDIGLKIARLPVSASLGRALLAAAEADMDCLEDMVNLAACLSGEAIFLSVEDEEGRERAETARRSLMRRQGDHFTMLAALRGFLAETADRKAWAEQHYISHRAMRGVLDIRKQLRALMPTLKSSRSAPSGAAAVPAAIESTTTTATDNASNRNSSDNPNLLRALLCGFPLNAALLSPDGSYRTLAGRQAVAIHPSSVLYGQSSTGQHKPAAIVYSEFVYTTRAYARGVSSVQREWVLEALGA